MSRSAHVRVPAKVNLALRVGGTDDTGYHALGTVFQALSLYDDVVATPAPAGEYRLEFRGEGAAFLPVDDTNLAIRAAKLFSSQLEVAGAGVRLQIRKRIPVAGGMAGGSANAAGVLLACNELWGCGATRDQLAGLGAQLGADVPFLLYGGTAHGTGRGDLIEVVPSQGEYYWTLALSHGGLSTPAVFDEFDRLGLPASTELPPALLPALAQGDLDGVAASLVNDLTQPALSLMPILERTLQLGQEAGALGSILSGSGPTCAFLSRTEDEAEALAEALSLFSGVRAARVAVGEVPGAELL